MSAAKQVRERSMNDIWSSRDLAKTIGAQIRAGVPLQRNPDPLTVAKRPSWITNFLRRLFGAN